MIRLTIDGKQVEAQEGQAVLDVARAAGAEIPTLCEHAAVVPYGSCRLCLVEVSARGRTRVVTSCCYPARDGVDVLTNTDRILKARRGVMELLLARAPESKTLRALAASMGVTESHLPTVTHAERDCILCGLCVSVCRDVMGAAAISFVNRGVERTVASPFLESGEACLGCGACAAVCPMGTVELRWYEAGIEVVPFKAQTPGVRCRECGATIGGRPLGERVRGQLGEGLGRVVDVCAACKQHAAAAALKRAGTMGRAWSSSLRGENQR